MSADLQLDPFGYGEDFHRALADRTLASLDDDSKASERQKEAAYRLARTLGRCRLYGIPINADTDGILPKAVAIAAAQQFAQQLDQWHQRAEQIAERWDRAADGVEAEDLCGGLLSARMDAWAIWIAIDESYARALSSELSDSEPFDAVIDDVAHGLERFDLALQKQANLLSSVCDTYLLENWRERLGDAYREHLPWWMDGTLEAIAEDAYEETLNSLPGVVSWTKLRIENSDMAPIAELPRFVEIRVASRQEDTIESSPHLAQALQEPLDESATTEGPIRSWERVRIDAGDLHWHSGHAETGAAEISVEWYKLGYLFVMTHGLFRRGTGYSLYVQWFDAAGQLKCEAATSANEPRAPLVLKPGDCDEPQPGDQLAVRHVWEPPDGEGWDVSVTVQF